VDVPPRDAQVDRLAWLKRRGMTGAMAVIVLADAVVAVDALRRGFTTEGIVYMGGPLVFGAMGFVYWRNGR